MTRYGWLTEFLTLLVPHLRSAHSCRINWWLGTVLSGLIDRFLGATVAGQIRYSLIGRLISTLLLPCLRSAHSCRINWRQGTVWLIDFWELVLLPVDDKGQFDYWFIPLVLPRLRSAHSCRVNWRQCKVCLIDICCYWWRVFDLLTVAALIDDKYGLHDWYLLLLVPGLGSAYSCRVNWRQGTVCLIDF